MLLWMMLGCTFQPGTGFSTLTGGTLDAALVPGEARDLGDDTVLTDEGFEVQVDTLELELVTVELEELQGAEGVDFDPADPPEGYTLCHGGHCHAEDGSLLSYAEVEAELAGGSATLTAVVSLPVDETADLLAGVHLDLGEAELPMAELSQATVTPGELFIEASADGEPLSLRLPVNSSFAADLPFTIDRDAEPELALTVDLAVDGTLFDGIDLSDCADGLDDTELATLSDNLLANPLQVALQATTAE